MMNNILRYSGIFLCLAVMLSCCSSSRKSAKVPAELSDSSPVLSFTTTEGESKTVEAEPSGDRGTERMDFAAEFLRKAAHSEGLSDNLVISPLSAGYALSLLLEGSTGKTREELLAVLGGSFEDIVPYTDEKTIVTTASSVWLKNGITVLDSYEKAISEKLSAQVYTRDFASKGTVKEINSWCSDHTAGRIPTIVSELPEETVMLLLNALYFKAPWLKAFDRNDTSKGTFHAAGGDQTNVSFMGRKARIPYYRMESFGAVSLDYDQRYSMLVILPDKGVDISSVVASLDGETLKRVIGGTYPTQVELKLPRFTIETSLSLNSILKDMGLNAAFNGGFGRMTTAPVAVSEVNQKCFIKVNEEGAEAAAVTSVSMRLTSVARPDPPVEFIVDRPFVFAIYDRETNDIYFEGCIVKIEDKED